MKNLRNIIIICIAIAALLLIGGLKAGAQKAEIGLRFMPTFSSISMHIS